MGGEWGTREVRGLKSWDTEVTGSAEPQNASTPAPLLFCNSFYIINQKLNTVSQCLSKMLVDFFFFIFDIKAGVMAHWIKVFETRAWRPEFNIQISEYRESVNTKVVRKKTTDPNHLGQINYSNYFLFMCIGCLPGRCGLKGQHWARERLFL